MVQILDQEGSACLLQVETDPRHQELQCLLEVETDPCRQELKHLLQVETDPCPSGAAMLESPPESSLRYISKYLVQYIQVAR